MKAFAFMYYLFKGTPILKEAVESTLLRGMAFEHSALMGIRKQPPELSLASMKTLEEFIFYDAFQEVIWVVLGASLLAAYLRARFYDCNNIIGYRKEGKTFTFIVEKTKTSKLDSSRLELVMILQLRL